MGYHSLIFTFIHYHSLPFPSYSTLLSYSFSYTIILSHSLHSLPFPSYSTLHSYSLSYIIIISIPFTLYPSLIFTFIHYHSLHSPYLLFLFLCWIVRYDRDFLGFL